MQKDYREALRGRMDELRMKVVNATAEKDEIAEIIEVDTWDKALERAAEIVTRYPNGSPRFLESLILSERYNHDANATGLNSKTPNASAGNVDL